ncbi:LOW QUALITY PROTEIN: heat shock factor protein 2 [Neosynchiropus ocellatus]
MKHISNVPAFLIKLWTLVEDPDTDELICWSQGGGSFMVLDEQRFAMEILPKFFKHNNISSFIRQLNMYGFRKVLHIDSGIVKQERDGPVEFQHPYFKHGQDDLLGNIKRKVPNTRQEDDKICQEDLSKILSSFQNVHSRQENIDARLSTLRRENESLWREISDLRQKHVQQQQLIKKLIHFIVTLVQNNHILNLKRKRPILMTNKGKKQKYIHPIFDDNVFAEQLPANSLDDANGSETFDDVTICDISEKSGKAECAFEQSDIDIVEVELHSCAPVEEVAGESTEPVEQQRDDSLGSNRTASGPLQLNWTSSLSLEDPVKMMDSILNNNTLTQNINLLGKMELMDYLDSIDCSLEDFQAMLYGKSYDAEHEDVSVKESPFQLHCTRVDEASITAHKQLIQYTSCPLLGPLNDSTNTDLDFGTSSGTRSSLSPLQLTCDSEPPTELLDSVLEKWMIRLTPLTEAEACDETLFLLCEHGEVDGNPSDEDTCDLLVTPAH